MQLIKKLQKVKICSVNTNWLWTATYAIFIILILHWDKLVKRKSHPKIQKFHCIVSTSNMSVQFLGNWNIPVTPIKYLCVCFRKMSLYKLIIHWLWISWEWQNRPRIFILLVLSVCKRHTVNEKLIIWVTSETTVKRHC